MKSNSSTLPTSLAKQESTLSLWLNRENKLFSYLREESISNANVLRVSHTFTAFTCLISSSQSIPIIVLICLFWFIMTLYLCKKGGLK